MNAKPPGSFVMAGGGTGGHVIPSIAVAQVLRERGHTVTFVGTQRGMEARLVPAAGFPIEWIEIGGLKSVGVAKQLTTVSQLPRAVRRVSRLFQENRPRAVFSMGGYVAGPVMIAALLKRVPLVVMEPNAMPGATNRALGRFVARALLSFDEAGRWFPRDRSEVTGLPVRREFFELPRKVRGPKLTVLITGGSQGSRTLNRAAEESWPLFRNAAVPVRLIHQAGRDAHADIARRFAESGVEGEVVAFITDMPAAFAEADVVVCRSGAGSVAEIAAAGKASILVPFPFASDNHQLRNAEALARAGAAKLVLDAAMNGRRLFDEVMQMPEHIGDRAREFAKPGAAERSAEILESFG
jgi:UDP-N-acetylglucosamine--N-acetylmuramyl-(pentapeptide) pyrophosphoryl-undecaprenol N-acetylglucosamine transferase